MKIAILVYDASLIGGAEKVAINLKKEFSSYYETYLISLFYCNKKAENLFDLIVLSKKKCSITKNFFSLSKKLRGQLMEHEIDVLLVITAGVVTLAINALKKTDIKLLYSEHSNLENLTYGYKHRLRQYMGAKYSDAVVALTKRDKINFQKKFKIPSEKIAVIPNGFKKKDNILVEYNKNSKKIISVGRLEYVKGYDYLLNVAKMIAPLHKDWKWFIYGDGSLRCELEEKIKDLALQDFVILKGNCNNMDEVYGNYSFMVMTSRYEGFPMALLEAKMHGLPLISFDCPTGPAELIVNDVNGYLVDCYDLNLMRKAIEKLIVDEEKRVDFSKSSLEGLDKFSQEAIVKLWRNLFESMVEE